MIDRQFKPVEVAHALIGPQENRFVCPVDQRVFFFSGGVVIDNDHCVVGFFFSDLRQSNSRNGERSN